MHFFGIHFFLKDSFGLLKLPVESYYMSSILLALRYIINTHFSLSKIGNKLAYGHSVSWSLPNLMTSGETCGAMNLKILAVKKCIRE